MVESLLFYRNRSRWKNTRSRSRSKMDRLRNTVRNTGKRARKFVLTWARRKRNMFWQWPQWPKVSRVVIWEPRMFFRSLDTFYLLSNFLNLPFAITVLKKSDLEIHMIFGTTPEIRRHDIHDKICRRFLKQKPDISSFTVNGNMPKMFFRKKVWTVNIHSFTADIFFSWEIKPDIQ